MLRLCVVQQCLGLSPSLRVLGHQKELRQPRSPAGEKLEVPARSEARPVSAKTMVLQYESERRRGIGLAEQRVIGRHAVRA